MKAYFFGWLMGVRKKFKGSGLGKFGIILKLYKLLFSFLAPVGIINIKLNGLQFRVNADDVGMAPQLLEGGVYEPFETELFKKEVLEGMTVLTVGANFGYYTLLAAKGVGKEGLVIGFEPEPSNYELLSFNVSQLGQQNIIVEQLAVSDSEGSLKLYTDSKNVGNPSFAKENIQSYKGECLVSTVTIDSYLKSKGVKKVDVLQIDTQGSEYLVLSGAKDMLRHRPVIFMEFWPFGLINMGADPMLLLSQLAGLGYKTYLIDEITASLKEVSAVNLLELCTNSKAGKGFANLLFKTN